MASDDSNGKSPIEFISHERSESASVFIALAVGIFSILILYGEVDRYSPAWIVLTITYWFMFVFGMNAALSWALNALIMSHYRAKNIDNLDVELKELIRKNLLLRRLSNNLRKDRDISKDNIIIWVGVIGCIIIGMGLWFVMAYNFTCFVSWEQFSNNIWVEICP